MCYMLLGVKDLDLKPQGGCHSVFGQVIHDVGDFDEKHAVWFHHSTNLLQQRRWLVNVLEYVHQRHHVKRLVRKGGLAQCALYDVQPEVLSSELACILRGLNTGELPAHSAGSP